MMSAGLAAACALALGLATVQPARAQATAVRDLAVVDGTLPAAQRLIVVAKGDALRWRVSSNRAGALHLHAYRLNLPLQPGQPADLAFTAHASGRFRIEWHGAGEAPAAGGAHHAAPLAVLEVRPR